VNDDATCYDEGLKHGSELYVAVRERVGSETNHQYDEIRLGHRVKRTSLSSAADAATDETQRRQEEYEEPDAFSQEATEEGADTRRVARELDQASKKRANISVGGQGDTQGVRNSRNDTGQAREEKEPISFTDAIGRTLSFPFEMCSTWSVCFNAPDTYPWLTGDRA
jgi:hypothetical protein